MSLAGRCFSSPCPQPKRTHELSSNRRTGLQSRTQAPFEIVVVYRLAEVANDSVLQGLIPDDFIGVCSHEDRRNRVPRVDQMPVQLDSGHSGHVNVGDQAAGFREETRCEEIGR